MERKPNGQFNAIPLNQKTPRMLEIEKRLGRSLEEDFNEYYVKRGWGQKRIAQRWGVQRQLIFGHGYRSKRRSWIERLGLTLRVISNLANEKPDAPDRSCAICRDPKLPTENAHWIAHSKGGSRERYNIIRLCPNHHTLLDSGDAETEHKVKEILLIKELCKILHTVDERDIVFSEIVNNIQSIVLRKP
ncbi:MAG: hypothetical protein ACM3S2_08635 [Ignavibacteriales bacterium]